MGLSVCCATADPPGQVVASLERLRSHADEVVVAVDTRVDPRGLGGYAALADRLFRFEFQNFVERSLPWLHSQCTQEWILRIDGDEVVSGRLVEQLGELTSAGDVIQYWLPRCLLFPDGRRWLREWPWWPDYQVRLFRNDPLLWTPGRLHTSIAQASPARFLEEAVLYHLEALVLTVDEREAKRATYATLDPASRSEWLFKLPDQDSRTASVDVPDMDVDAIAAVLGARTDGPRRGAPAVKLVTRSEIDRYWPERLLDPSAYRATIRVLDQPRRLFAGEQVHLRLVVRNEGKETWPGGAERLPLIRLGHRWLEPSGPVAVGSEGRADFPAQLRPDEECVLPVTVAAPPAPGRYVLELDLVHEFVRWFQQPTRLTLAVDSGE